MNAAAAAVARVSKRSAMVTTTSGFRFSKTEASSTSPSPVVMADVWGVSPSRSMNTREAIRKPSFSITVDALP